MGEQKHTWWAIPVSKSSPSVPWPHWGSWSQDSFIMSPSLGGAAQGQQSPKEALPCPLVPPSTGQRGPSFWQWPVPPLRFQTPSPLSSEIANFCSVSTGCQPLWWVSWVHNNNPPLPLVAATENIFHLNPIQLPSSTVLVLPSPHFLKFIYNRHLHALPAPTLALPGSPS